MQLRYNEFMAEELNLESLRKKHPRFIYQSYTWSFDQEKLNISFNFKLEPDIEFQPKITISYLDKTKLTTIPKGLLDAWIFNLGLIELFSYWKAAASPEILIEAGYLNQDQINWWQDLLLQGMGEYFYTNQINFTSKNFIKILVEHQPTQPLTNFNLNSTGPYLVPIGGGKDSALVTNLLEKNQLPYEILLSYPQSPAALTIAQSHHRPIIEIKRVIDPKLLELNKLGYLNGHTPFSARLAFESSLVALINGHQAVLLANEFSANEGNVPYLGTIVNHQYSKSFDFENKFRAYLKTYLKPAPSYLSLLRPLTELQIAAIFAQDKEFHSVFRSCNRGQQKNVWCGECPKCLFVFTILYPFVDEQQLTTKIFAENLFNKPTMKQTAQELMGLDATKPFECVGTHEETQTAFYLSIKKWQKTHPNEPLPVVLEFVNQTILKTVPDLATTAQMLLCFWNQANNLDEKLTTIVQAAAQDICKNKTQYL